MDYVDVSVVIPCYRCEQTIERAVESIARQTMLPKEVILVDDGSDDVTPSVLTRLQKNYGTLWLRILSLGENRGVSVARNAGWDCAVSKYVAFLDADDAWHERKLELQYTWMQAHPEVAICGHRSVITQTSHVESMAAVSSSPAVKMVKTWQVLVWNPFVTPSFFVRRSLPCRFDDTRRYSEDHLLLMQTALSGYSIGCIESELAYIFKRPGETGASSQLWKMRVGAIQNYLLLWRGGRLRFGAAAILALLSMLKGLTMLLVGPQTHFAMRRLYEKHLLRRDRRRKLCGDE